MMNAEGDRLGQARLQQQQSLQNLRARGRAPARSAAGGKGLGQFLERGFADICIPTYSPPAHVRKQQHYIQRLAEHIKSPEAYELQKLLVEVFLISQIIDWGCI